MRHEVHGGSEDTLDRVASAAGDGRPDPSEPSWPGFRAGRSSTIMKIRGDARAAMALALVIIVATLAVLGAAPVGTAAEDLGALLGFTLHAEGSLR